MKINPGWRPVDKELRRMETETSAQSQVQQKNFTEMLKQHDETSKAEQLKQLLQKIQDQGDRLAKSMTVRELRAYKLLVTQFLEETVKRGIVLKETRGWDRRGRGRRYKLLEEIDGRLLEMADELLQREDGKIRLLHNVGEIRGLLINLLY